MPKAKKKLTKINSTNKGVSLVDYRLIERLYFMIMVIFGIYAYYMIMKYYLMQYILFNIVMEVDQYETMHEIYGVNLFMLFCFCIILLSIILLPICYAAFIKDKSIKISPERFSEIHEMVKINSKKLKLQKIPEVYVSKNIGMFDIFAYKFFCRDYIMLDYKVVKMAFHDKDAVEFIIAHELAHIKRKHTSAFNRLITLPSIIIFPLWLAYRRASEYDCDTIAYSLCSKGAITGVIILVAGPKLNFQVDLLKSLVNDESTLKQCMNYPYLFKRLKNLRLLEESELKYFL